MDRIIKKSFPLSSGQEAMWFIYQIAPESVAYNIFTTVKINSYLNIVAVNRVWKKIIERHPILRTTYTSFEGKPVQQVNQQYKCNVEVINASNWSEDYLKEKIFAITDSPFNLEKDAVLRINLFTRSTKEHILLLTMHHIAGDMWSFDLLLSEFQTLYAKEIEQVGQEQIQTAPDSLTENKSYLDFVRWQSEMLSGSRGEKLWQYWQKQLAGELPILNLFADKPRPPVQTYQGTGYSLKLDEQLIQKLKYLALASGTSLYQVLLAAFYVLLYRYTNQTDILIGSPMRGRWGGDFKEIVGYFVNLMVLRTSVQENATFTEFLAHISKTVKEAQKHQDYPFSLLAEQLQPERDPSRSPLCQVSFTWQRQRWCEQTENSLHSGEQVLEMKPYLLGHQRGADFDLNLMVMEAQGVLQLCWQYNTDLFEASTITRMAGHFVTLLEGIVLNPQEQIWQLPLLIEIEQQQLLVGWNDTGVDYLQDKCIHQLFEEQVDSTPDAIAVVFENQQLTYQQLNCRANQLAHYLQSLGVGENVLVGLCVERSLEMVVGLLGILKAGGAYVPLDPEYPAERLSFMLKDTQVKVLLTQERLVESLPQHQACVVCLDTDWQSISQANQDNLNSTVSPENLSYVIYTSGSTGTPKGVAVNHQAVNRLVLNTNYIQLTADECVAQAANIAFDAATFEIWGALLSGAKLVIITKSVLLIPEEFAVNIHEHQISVLFLTTALFNQLASVVPQAFSSLRYLLFGGEAVDPKWVLEVLDKGAPQHLLHVYGPTENTTFSSWYLVEDLATTATTIPIGRAIANTQIYILDQNLQPVPVGVPGEIYLGGAGLAQGYFNRPELTKEKFIPNPFDNSKLYKTGDLAHYLADGNIEYLGRIDNQVKIRGFRIELSEIEVVLSQHSDVQVSCVIVREDTPGDKRLVAYVVAHQDCKPTISELRQFLKAKLPDYMVPNAIVILESLPLTPNGKVDRRALPIPDLHSEQQDKFVAPRNPMEEMLALLWTQVLKVELLGIHDNFFELGGHSLLATQLVSRIRNVFKVELPLRELFARATVAELAQSIRQLQQQDLELSERPILPKARDAELLLSYAQQRLWFLDQFEPNSAFYNIPMALRLVGNLNQPALEQSLLEIIHRHEALRTNFITVDGKPSQIIQTQTNWTVSVIDLKYLSTTDREITSQELARQQAIEPFDLANGALIRTTLLVLSETEHILLVCMHHVVSDGWSMAVFVQELAALYDAYAQSQPSPLTPLPIQYADFAIWQREWLQGNVLQNQLTYWQQQLANAPALLSLPTDRPRPAVQTFAGAYQKFALSAELTGRLIQLSQQQGVTLFMTLLAAFDTLLYRYTGVADILVGSPIANRDRSEIEGLIGFFVNTLVMRTDLAGNPSFSELLTRVREIAMEAYSHQHLPFEMLVEALQPERDLSHTPLFQVMFTLQNAPISTVELNQLSVSSTLIEGTTAKFDLTLSMENTATGVVGVWEYSTDLFDASTIERMTGHFVTLLESIIANPQQSISQLPLLTEVEQQQLLVEWNNTQADYPQDKCLHQLFEEQVARTPDAVAVVFENQQLTYQQLNCRANKLAHYLQSLGVGADVLVGICLERSLLMVVGLLGILKAGGAYVPLDPDYPQERLSFMLEDAQLRVLLTQQQLKEKLPQHQGKVVYLDTDWQFISQSSQENLITTLQDSNLAYVIYTSGSTGKPKGAMNTHLGICNRLLWMQQAYQLTAVDCILQKTPFSFDVSVWEFFWPLITGARLVVAKPGGHKDSAYLVNLIQEQHVTHVHFVPSMLQVFLEEPSLENCRSLKRVICSGEALPVELQERFFARLECELHNLYGPTEAAIDVTYWQCFPDGNLRTVPIGRAIANTQIYILDEHLQPVPVGVAGELHIGGAGLARGYLNRPELTKEKFISNPFDNSKLYKTGDLARYLPDGTIEYIGRIDNQVKIRGFRIELGEIEVLLNQYEEVQASCVIAREDITGDKRLVAYIVPHQHSKPTTNELRQFLKAKLPDYMVPSAFVILESMPLTSNGKVDRRALPAPDLYSEIKDKYVAPRTPIEEILAQTWSQVLQLPQVGIHDNFFELGGHSLLATQLVSRIRNIFKVELPLRELFAAATLAELAREIEQLQQQVLRLRSVQDLQLSAPPILPRAENAQLALSYAQQRLWFLDQFEPNSPFYNMSIALRLAGTVEVAALEQSFQQIIHRHEALRTNFITVNGQATQIIQTETNWTVSVVDLKHLSTTKQEIASQQLVQQQAIQPFELATQALVRATLVVLSETEHILLMCIHHIVSDGWSIGLFLQELAALYNAYSQGKSSTLAPLPIQYADFALWQRQWLQGEVLQSQLSYWQQKLASAPTLLSLPTDRPRPAVQTYQGTHQEFALSEELTSKLAKLSQEQGVTLFITLLAAFDTLLYRYTGTEDILVGSPIANRDRSEIEGLIGFFVNTLVMRTDLSGNPSFSELLGRVREMAMEAYSHQHLPFEMLVEALQPERDLSHSPLFQVMFVLQNAPTSGLELTGLTVSSLPIKGTTSRFDLTLIMQNTPTGLVGVWEYNTDLFDASTIERMTGHFVTLLEGIIANPEGRISQLPLLTQPEQQKLLVEWNDTQVYYPQDLCIHQLFEEQVDSTPDAVAVVFEDQQLTYYELNYRANQLAHYLRSFGVGSDTLVGLCVERSLEMVIGLLGILKAGAAYVPLDPEYPSDRLSFILEDAQVRVLLTQQSILDRLHQHQAHQVYLDTDAKLISQCSQDNLISDVQANNLAYIIYTSGSTGQPKGIAMNQLALGNLILWHRENLKISRGAKTLQFASISFDVSFQEIFTTWCSGGTLFLIGEELRRDTSALLGFLQQQAIERMFLPFVALQQLAEVAIGGELVNSHLREIITAGEQLQITPAISQWLSKLTDCTLHNHYGPSESHLATSFTLTNSVETWPLLPPIGRPIANAQIYILDKYLQPVPVGVPGELYIAGVLLSQGYFNRPELTLEKFIPNPFKRSRGAGEHTSLREAAPTTPLSNQGSRGETFNSDRLYKTGDLARYLSDGNIEYLGRIDNQVKIRGFRIELGEIEAVLSQLDVQASCAIAREDIPGNKRLVAYIVPQKEQTCTERSRSTLTVSFVRSFLKEKLPEYMVPSAIVILEVLPLTPNGKLDRRALPAPDLHSQLLDKYVAPRNPIEEILSLIWAQVLKVEQVGIHDNFFELGGHSLLATQLISRVRTSLKVELPLRSLFAAPTVAELSQNIQRLQQQDLELIASPILPRAENAELPLSFAQTRLWFLDKLNPNSAFYNFPITLRLVGTLNRTALEQSLQEIVHRHEALRTNFVIVDGKPSQIIQTQLNCPLSVIDLKHLSTTEQEIASQQLAQQPFDLANEALVRATLVVLSQTEHALLVCMHHIVSDGWSMGVFVQELAALYNAYSQGEPSPLTPLPIQYADFAIWQRNWLQGDVLQSQLSYWQQQLANAPALLSLPTDRPRPSMQTFAGAYQQFALSKELTDKLTQLSQQQGVTLFMTLLAAFDTLLYRYTGTEDILVGSPIANRDRSEIEGLIGFFLNTLVMRTNLAGNPSFSELLGRVREMAMDAYSHQNLPFEMLVEALQPERDLSHTPLFQVMFVLQNAPISQQLELTGLTVSPLVVKSTTTKFDLTLAMENTATGMVGMWEYNTDLFDASTIERMTGHFLTLLEGIIANPEERISQLPLLTEFEQHQLLVEWTDTQVDYPLDKCIHQLFEEQVQRTPDAVAVFFEDQQLTYQQLNSRANQLAHYLKSLGVGADVLVGICVERSIEMVVGLLGILKAGGAYLPLDPEYPTERLHFMLEDAQVSVLLTQQKLLDRLAQHQAKLVCLDTDWQLISQSSQDNLITETQATNLAYVIYTSGSTGQPKGVLIAHQGLLNLVFWHQSAFKITTLDKATQLAGTAFDAAVWELWPYLTAGASIYLVKSEFLSSLVKLRDWLISKQITISFLPTPLAQELLSLEWPTESLALRTILTGGDKLHQYPSDLVPFQLVNNYGPTENTVVTTSGLVVAKEQDQISPSIGRAIANTQIYILDSNLQPVPIGIPGELHIAGVGLAKGYLNRPDLTTEKFIPNPFKRSREAGEQGSRGAKILPNSQSLVPSPRLYKTGDLARYLPDGNIEYLGRIDNQVKIRGFRIELAEVEALLGQHDDVQICCVIAREETSGNTCTERSRSKRLVAYVVPHLQMTCTERSRSTPTTDELRQFLDDKLPGYMVPSVFVMLESLPLTPNGKVDRRALPAPDLQQELSNYVMPNTEVERIIAGIWQKTLEVEKVGIYNNFFELGGHSLLLVRINQQLQEKFGLEVSIVDMFNYPTIHRLSQYLSTKLNKEDTLKQNNSRPQSPSESKAFRNQQLQLRQQYLSQRKGKKL
ncbi:non-ribosomal peptide synthase/polyketide synthase [Nostoc punctiforme UO1]|uniref:non-ribosomal peptide synthetase n=1 Tax=Nostoc punctiforme TaxID=272131 RepID=UPI0030AB822A